MTRTRRHGLAGRVAVLWWLIASFGPALAEDDPFRRVEIAPRLTRGKPPPGQIIIDPEHPRWLKRAGGKHVFICGPGDPEDFLYRGRRNPDGARDGDQTALVKKLIEHGGNCIYMQVVRSHGGDGPPDHNPFVDADPARGLDEDILKQWEEWFTRMDDNGILIYLFFYDDGANPWKKVEKDRDEVPTAEKDFLEALVKRFRHHRNLIWVVAEECEEAFTPRRVRAAAEVIRRADGHGHLIGAHHHSGTTFKAWKAGGALNHFSMQYTASGDKAHAGAVEAFRKAKGKYQVIYAESTAAKPDAYHAWRVAMGGLMPMLLKMDIAGTPAEALRQCRHLQRFFEATDFYTMTPHDGLAHAGTRYVLAAPGRSYIAYSEKCAGKMGLKDLPAGDYKLAWLDCKTGATKSRRATVQAGDAEFERPAGIGEWCAVWVRAARGQGGGADGQPAVGPGAVEAGGGLAASRPQAGVAGQAVGRGPRQRVADGPRRQRGVPGGEAG